MFIGVVIAMSVDAWHPLLYNKHKEDRFGLEGVDWGFNGVTNPTTTSLQPLLLSPYIEAKQINLEVRIIEDRNYQQLGDW